MPKVGNIYAQMADCSLKEMELELKIRGRTQKFSQKCKKLNEKEDRELEDYAPWRVRGEGELKPISSERVREIVKLKEGKDALKRELAQVRRLRRRLWKALRGEK